jgi:pimeloyl-ACP methyl ester carboxylesterase
MSLLSHDVRGSGDHTVFMLHGFLGSGRNLQSLARRWSEREPRLRLVLPDLTGHGMSPSPRDPPTLEQVARDVLALADDVKADEPLTIVGHSFGGRTALAMRMVDPARIGHVVLLDITPNPLRGDVGGLDRVLEHVLAAPARVASRDDMRTLFLGHGISPALTDWVLLNLMQDGDGLRWRFDRDKLKALHEQARRESLWPAVESPGVKTTLIHGGRSRFVSEADVDRFNAAGADVIRIAEAGHFLHVDAQPALLDHLVTLAL